METREGFGEHGNVAMFDDFPTVTTVAETLAVKNGPGRSTIHAVLDELAFCMKTATRLGRVVRIGERWWGHPQAYGSRQMEVADEYERTGMSADEFDLWAVLDPSDLIALVSLRTGIVTTVVDLIVSEFCAQVESFHVHGIHFRTPPRELGPSSEILDQLVANPEALAVHDHLFTSAEPASGVDDEQPRLICRDAEGGWLVIELHVEAEDPRTSPSISPVLDAIAAEYAAAGQRVSGLVLSDGYSQMFVEQAMRDERVVHRNLRSLDLPVCRAQRWSIRPAQSIEEVGWVAVAADGRTVVGGGGEAFPTLALFEPFEQIAIDWNQHRLWPQPVIGAEHPRPDGII